MTRLHPDQFDELVEAIAARVVSLMGVSAPQRPQAKTPGQIAIEMAKSGDLEGSRQFLRSQTKRKAA